MTAMATVSLNEIPLNITRLEIFKLMRERDQLAADKRTIDDAVKNAIKSTRAEQSATVVDLRKQVADLDDTLKEQAKFHDERLAQTKSFYDDFINDLHRQIDALGGTDLGQKMLKEKERRNLQDKHAKMVQEAGAIAKQIDALGE